MLHRVNTLLTGFMSGGQMKKLFLWHTGYFRNPEDVDYAKWLLDIGDGRLTAEDSNITLSAKKKCGDTGQSLID